MIAIAPFPAAAVHWLARAWRVVVQFLLVCCCACGAADGTAADVQNFDEEVRTFAQGCSWRGGPTDEYQPREPASCYDVFAWQDTRLTDHPLANPCDAVDAPNPLLVRPDHPQLWGYYDRDKADRFQILRFERLDACP